MIIIIATIALLIIGGIFLIVYHATKENYEIVGGIAFILLLTFGLAMFGECLGVALSHGTARNKYNKLIYQKGVLEYRLENDGLTGNELLYRDITDFNNTIREARYWYENPWTSWFCSGLIPSIDYIELDTNNNA